MFQFYRLKQILNHLSDIKIEIINKYILLDKNVDVQPQFIRSQRINRTY